MSTTDPEARKRHNATYYAKNREKIIATNARITAANRLACQNLVWDYLAEHPCLDCGEADPLVLEFDHRDPATKSYNIGASLSGNKYAGDLAREIAKCDVRCANCHRRRTAEVGQHWRWIRSQQ